MKKIIMAVILCTALCTAVFAQNESDFKTDGSTLIFVSLSQITKDYGDNAIAAENKWYSKDVVIEGRIDEIERDMFGRPIIMMYGNGEALKFIFPDNYSLNKYKSGQRVKIKGWVGKRIMSVINIIDCSIYNE